MTEQENLSTNEEKTTKKWTKKRLVLIIALFLLITLVIVEGYSYIYKLKLKESGWDEPMMNCGEVMVRQIICKPIIYLYPEREQETYVQLNFNGKLMFTYPAYNEKIKGWKVKAYLDGRLVNDEDKKEYSYLFWEGLPHSASYDMSKGFVIEGKDTAKFLQEMLSKMGLVPKEYNEFIVYWLPIMQNNRYNLIHFAGEEYTKNAQLEITPKPDSLLRVFMVFKPLDEKIEVEPQTIEQFERKGFTVVEWGGTELAK